MARGINKAPMGFVKTITSHMATAVLAISATMLVTAAPALAQSSVRSGTISSVFLSGANNYAFRVSLQQNGASTLTGCNGQFAYINTSQDNYQAYVAELTTLYVRGTPVALTIAPDANGYCQLQEFSSQ